MARLFVFGLFLKAQARKKKVIHIVDERVHILLIKSGKIELDRCACCTYTTASAEGLRPQSIKCWKASVGRYCSLTRLSLWAA